MPSTLWQSTGTTRYGAGGGRDVLIIVSDLPLSDSEAVARRPGQLTKEDKQSLQNQGVSPDCQDELTIVKERHDLDKRFRIVGVKLGQPLSRGEVIKSISNLLTTTQNDGGKVFSNKLHHYTVYNQNLITFSCNLLHRSWEE